MTAGMPGPGNAMQCPPVAANGSNRSVLNTKVFAFVSCCKASLNESITTYCADLMDNWLIVTQKRDVLKTLSKNFQR